MTTFTRDIIFRRVRNLKILTGKHGFNTLAGSVVLANVWSVNLTLSVSLAHVVLQVDV